MDLKQALEIAKRYEEFIEYASDITGEKELCEALIIIKNEMTDLFKKVNAIQNAFAIYHKANAKANRQIKKVDDILCNWLTGIKES